VALIDITYIIVVIDVTNVLQLVELTFPRVYIILPQKPITIAGKL